MSVGPVFEQKAEFTFRNVTGPIVNTCARTAGRVSTSPLFMHGDNELLN